MRIAYIILAYKLPEQLVRLVRKLQDDTASFLIHIDKNTDAATYERMAAPLRSYNNVSFLARRVCRWGGFGPVQVTLDAIQQIVTLDIPCDYVVLLTAQDYPLKSITHVQRVLHDSHRQSFIEYFSLPSEQWKHENGGLDRLTYWHFNVGGRHLALMKRSPFKSPGLRHLWSRVAALPPIRRRPPAEWAMFGGGAYWCLTRECLQYVNDFVQREHEFVKFFKHVSISNEIFFQTIILNSPFKDRVVNESLWYTSWSTSPHPAILRQQDVHQLITSDKLFARKFDVTVDRDVLDMIDREVG